LARLFEGDDNAGRGPVGRHQGRGVEDDPFAVSSRTRAGGIVSVAGRT
jgi:hypothetical protein